ncbi:MAG: hypothetical protein WCE62_02525 [Polyangiales bacterium]
MERIRRHSIALFMIGVVMQPLGAFGQQAQAAQPRDEPSSIVVIDSPPPPTQRVVPSPGVILERPGQVLLSGTPVRAQFRSPTDGVSFQLRVGGSYSSISGISYGMGWGGWGGWGWGGPGWGWGGPGWGWGGYGVGYGVAPYYGEVVTSTFQPICEAPCDATLLSGRHRIALSLQGGAPVNVPEPIDLTTDSIVEGRYIDKRRIRKAGWATFIAGSVAGMAMMFASIDYNYNAFYGNQIRYQPMFYTGVGLFVSSIITGAVLASQDDEAQVTVYPVE